jgi:hypothetical protein
LSSGVDGGVGDGLFLEPVWSRNLTNKFVGLRVGLLVIESGERNFGLPSIWLLKCESIVSDVPGDIDFVRIPESVVGGNAKVRFSSWDSMYSCKAICRRSSVNCLYK